MITSANFEPTLGFALTFNAEDLAANRAGQLSHRQAAAMRAVHAAMHAAAPRYRAKAPYVTLFFVAILGSMGGAIYATGVFTTLQTLLGTNIVLAMVGTAALAIAFLAWVTSSYQHSVDDFEAMTADDQPLPGVRVLTGRVKVRRSANRADGMHDRNWYVIINKEWLTVTERAVDVFDPEQTYHIYTQDHNGTLIGVLSAEPATTHFVRGTAQGLEGR